MISRSSRRTRGRMHSCEWEACGAPPRRAALVKICWYFTALDLTATFVKALQSVSTNFLLYWLGLPRPAHTSILFWESLDEQVCISQILCLLETNAGCSHGPSQELRWSSVQRSTVEANWSSPDQFVTNANDLPAKGCYTWSLKSTPRNTCLNLER